MTEALSRTDAPQEPDGRVDSVVAVVDATVVDEAVVDASALDAAALDPVDGDPGSVVPPMFSAPGRATTRPPAIRPAANRRVRDRLRITSRGGTAPAVMEPLLRTMRKQNAKVDLKLVQRAYELADAAHEGQFRRSGDPYITHPLAVAGILAELGMDESTVIAAILHDTVEDTTVALETVREEFGELVALIVDGVTKLDKVKVGQALGLAEGDAARAAEAETIRKMVIAMAKDPRVLVVKLADRLHNMRTLRFLPQAKQERKAQETLDIFAPLAHRLGMNTLKWELEDLSFATLYPKRYDEIVRLVADRAPSRDTYLAEVVSAVDGALAGSKIKATVTGRPKHYYSIYQKMIVRGRDFTDIYDLVGLRILVESVRDCYAVLGSVHAMWNPVPGRFKDYIAMPKFNMYQSLHTTVIGPGGKPVELQIRTTDMHRIADYGIAAHWKYKESLGRKGDTSAPVDRQAEMAWLKQILDWQRETSDPAEFLDSLRFDLHTAEVFVFTPKGGVVALPAGACPVDFAYAVHTEVGHRCIGARVNGRLVALESPLENGDTIEIFTSKAPNAGPSRDWQAFVTSPRARTKIRQWFARERRDDAIDDGKDAIQRAMRKQGLPLQRLMTGEAMTALAQELRYPDVVALFAAVGENHLSAASVVQRLVATLGGTEGAVEDLAETTTPTRRDRPRPVGDAGVVVDGMDSGDIWVKLSKCCTPVPGDEITGFVTRGNGVSVHRADCVNGAALAEQPERMVPVSWAPSTESVFLVAIQVEALDRTRLLADVTRMLSEQHVNILSASVTTTRDRVAVSRFTFEMASPEHLGHVLGAVRRIDGVFDCYRVHSKAG